MTLRQLGETFGSNATKARIDALRKEQRSLASKLGKVRKEGNIGQAASLMNRLDTIKGAIKSHKQWLGKGQRDTEANPSHRKRAARVR